jgi:hypothetical protein
MARGIVDPSVQRTDTRDNSIGWLEPRFRRVDHPHDVTDFDDRGGLAVQADVVRLAGMALDCGEELARQLVV